MHLTDERLYLWAAWLEEKKYKPKSILDAWHYLKQAVVRAMSAARAAWLDSKSRGFEQTYWQTDERGKWQKRE